MKKVVITILFIASFSFVRAQFTVGMQAGVNFGGPIGKTEGTGSPVPGFIGGPVFSYRFTDSWKITAPLLYSYRGVRYEQESENDSTVYVTVGQQQIPVKAEYTSTVKGELKLHYIDLPVMVNYYYLKRFSLDFGPQFSYLFAGSDKGSNDIVFVDNGIFNQKIEYNNYSDINRFDAGFALGASYHTDFGLTVSLRGSRGFVQVYKKGFFSSMGQEETSLYNTFIHFTLTYSFKKTEVYSESEY